VYNEILGKLQILSDLLVKMIERSDQIWVTPLIREDIFGLAFDRLTSTSWACGVRVTWRRAFFDLPSRTNILSSGDEASGANSSRRVSF
jgi:hypothetical protein